MKKANSILTLITFVFLFCHIVCTILMYSIGQFEARLNSFISRGMSCLVLAHAIISIISVVHSKSLVVKYANLNKTSIVQRDSGLLMIILLIFHIIAFKMFFNASPVTVGLKIFVCIVEVLFFACVLIHTSISLPNSLISLGLIRELKTEKIVRVIFRIICAILFISILLSIMRFIIFM